MKSQDPMTTPNPSAAERAPIASTPTEGGARAPLDLEAIRKLRQRLRDNRFEVHGDLCEEKGDGAVPCASPVCAIEYEAEEAIEALLAEVDRLRRRAGDTPGSNITIRCTGCEREIWWEADDYRTLGEARRAQCSDCYLQSIAPSASQEGSR